MKWVLKGVELLKRRFSSSHTVCKAARLMEMAIKIFVLQKYSESLKLFHAVLKVCEVVLMEDDSDGDAALEMIALTRLKLLSCFHVNNYYLNPHQCHLYVVEQECLSLYESLMCTSSVVACLADEFEPLPSGLPRLPSHSYLSRIPVLRELSSIRGILFERFQKKLPMAYMSPHQLQHCNAKNLYRVVGHTQSIFCLSSFSDCKLVSGGLDKTVRMWCTRNNEEMRSFRGHTNTVNCLCTLENVFASGGEDGQLIVWNVEAGLALCTRRHRSGVRCLHATQRLLFSGGADSNINIWDCSNKANLVLVRTLKETMPISSLAIVPDCTCMSTLVFSAGGCYSDCYDIRCWEGNVIGTSRFNYFKVSRLIGHTSFVHCLIVDERNNKLYSSSADNTIRVWNFNLKQEKCIEVGYPICYMIFYQDFLYSAGLNNTFINVLDAGTLSHICELDGHDDCITSLSISDGRLFSASFDTTIVEHLL